jgi:NAD(P) transhydrogenase
MLVVGGGVIGSEYGSVFTALGVQVTMVQTGDRLLPTMDSEISARLKTRLENLGMQFIFDERVTGVDTSKGNARLTLASGATVEAEVALYCTGRVSNTDGLNLDGVGVRCGPRGLVLVDDKYETNVPGIYATGDVVGSPALASTSMEQSRVAMAYAFDLPFKDRIAPVVPLAVYTIPEIAMAGLTEDACREQNMSYLTSHAYYDESPRGQIIGDTSGMLKLVFSPVDQKLLGVHHIGEMSSELVHIGVQVLCDGGTIERFTDMVFNYPTLSELYKRAAYDGYENLSQWEVLDTPATSESPTAAGGQAPPSAAASG